MASILGSPASSGQFPTCNLSTVWGALQVGVKIGSFWMPGHRFPAAVPYRTIAKHLEVLELLAGRDIGFKRVGHADAVKRHLRCAAILCGAPQLP